MILITIMIGYSAMAVAEAQPTANAGWQTTMQSIIGALDYVAIDYPEAVQAGTVVNAFEYAEQREFIATVNELMMSLPSRPERQALLSQTPDQIQCKYIANQDMHSFEQDLAII
jgi:high-affinity iron transporter